MGVAELIDALWRSRRIDLAEFTRISQQREIVGSDGPIYSREDFRLAHYNDLFLKVLRLDRSIQEPNEELWKEIQEAAADLRHDVPELAQFADAGATPAKVNDVIDAYERAVERLEGERKERGSRKQTWRLTPVNAFLLQDAPAELIFRYTDMNDRRILMLRHLIAEHCRTAVGGGDDAQS